MVFVSCASLVCPVGYSAASAAAALRAGVATFAETGYRDVQGEPIVGATVPALDPELRGQARLLALIRLALDAMEPSLAAQLPFLGPRDRCIACDCSTASEQGGHERDQCAIRTHGNPPSSMFLVVEP